MMYQYDLKVRAATYFGVDVGAMDLPYEAWKVLRDYFLSMTEMNDENFN